MAQGMTEDEAKRNAPSCRRRSEMLAWEQGDPEVRSLWQMMNGWVYAGFDETYRKLGVDFDKIYYESQTYLEGKAKVEEGLAKGVFYRRPDGRRCGADLAADGLDEKLLLRADGTSVYMTQDIGTAKMRFRGLPHRQDGVRGGQRAELPLPGALHPARPAGICLGQEPRALLLRHGGTARRAR